MDYEYYDPTSRYPPTKALTMIPGCAIFRLLEVIFSPINTSLKLLQDAVLVSLDLEYRFIPKLNEQRITQVGVAILDTKVLSLIDMENSESIRTAIQCRCFSVYRKRMSAKSYNPKFLWGDFEYITHDDIRAKLKEVLHDTGDIAEKSPRNIILVGHAIQVDRRVLNDTIGYDIKYVPSVKAILDTGRMICCAYDFGKSNQSQFVLRLILRHLRIDYDQIHNAGNDAMYTMKALLLIFANWKHQKGRYIWNVLDEAMFDQSSPALITSDDRVKTGLLWELQIRLLTAIAREPWPQKSAIRKLEVINRPVKANRDDRQDHLDLGLLSLFETVD